MSRSISRCRRFVLAALLTLVSAPPAAAQIEGSRFGAGPVFELYSFSDATSLGIESIQLLSLPFAGYVAVTPRFALELSGAWARASMSRPGAASLDISGLTDTELRASYTFGLDAVTLSAVVQLPGNGSLDVDEAQVAGAVAADVLPFRVTNWGSGGGAGAAIAVARPLGTVNAGISVGYVVAREFSPVTGDDDFTYRPGNQLHITAALDRDIGVTGRGALRVSYQHFAEDESNGTNLYQAGARIQATGSYAFAAGPRASAIVYGGYLHRAEGQFQAAATRSAAQDFLLAGGGLRLPLGRGIVQPGLDLRVARGTDEAATGYTAGIGVSAEWPTASLSLAPTVRARLGQVRTRPGTESAFTGAELGLVIRFGSR